MISNVLKSQISQKAYIMIHSHYMCTLKVSLQVDITSLITLSLTMSILSSTDSKSLGILCLRAEVRHGIFASLSKQVLDERWFAKVWMCVKCMEMLSCFYAPVKEVERCGQRDHCPLCTHTHTHTPDQTHTYTHLISPITLVTSCQGHSVWSRASQRTWPDLCLAEKFKLWLTQLMWCLQFK